MKSSVRVIVTVGLGMMVLSGCGRTTWTQPPPAATPPGAAPAASTPATVEDRPVDTDAGPKTRGFGAPDSVQDSYIVVLKSQTDATALAARYGGAVSKSYGSGNFSVALPESAARELAEDPAVAYVEQDRRVRVLDTQSNPTWGLDRVDQRELPLSGSYTYPNTAANVTAYILDTGVRISHQEFGGRASYGYDAIDGDTDANDCHGHGTHVAGTVAGRTYGVAKQAKVVAVRVLGCDGFGTTSQIIAGIDWVTRNAVKPAVVNMSIGGGASDAEDDAVRRSIAAGVTYSIAAGNETTDACASSPARTPEAITVGATSRTDARASFSNYGRCLDIFAPGDDVLSASFDSDTATTTKNGTSMAAPHVAGAAALILSAHPDATPAQVRDALVAHATTGAVTDAKPASPDALLFVGPTSLDKPKDGPKKGCGASSDTGRAIPDLGTAQSTVSVPACLSGPAGTATVTVRVTHPDPDQLAITLVSPTGTRYDVSTGESTVTLLSPNRSGQWTLQVRDTGRGGTGTLDGWSLSF